jgi:isovaleryl-CoA dehydrogenase
MIARNRGDGVVNWIELAEETSSEVLEPLSAEVDRTGIIPVTHFEQLASRGLYGVAMATADPVATLPAIGEILVSGCLSTAFVWAQHHGTLLRLATSRNESLKTRYLDNMRTGTVKAGVSGSGYAAPERPLMRASRVTGGYSITGRAPFVTGWNLIDVLGITAYDEGSDETVTFLAPAEERPGLSALPKHLVAANASNTVELEFDKYCVDEEDVVHVGPGNRHRRSTLSMLDRVIIRINGSLALGVSRGCLQNLDALGASSERLRARLAVIRDQLNFALQDRSGDIYAARAQASHFAVEVAAYYATVAGSGAVKKAGPAERLSREALFALVCTSTTEIRETVQASIEFFAHAEGASEASNLAQRKPSSCG